MRGFLALAEERLGFPMVVKECYGSLGGQVYLARNGTELRGLAERMAARPFIAQEFVASSAGRDIRLYMAGGRLIAAMRRYSDTDFRANIGGGGRAEAYTPTAEEIHLAARCCSLLKLDFGGVDLLHGEDGRPLVCEVNSNAHMAALTACSGVDVAGAILEHVLGREAERGLTIVFYSHHLLWRLGRVSILLTSDNVLAWSCRCLNLFFPLIKCRQRRSVQAVRC